MIWEAVILAIGLILSSANIADGLKTIGDGLRSLGSSLREKP